MRRKGLTSTSRYGSVSIANSTCKGIIPDTPILYYYSGVVIPIKCFRRILPLYVVYNMFFIVIYFCKFFYLYLNNKTG